jgi:AcrR family transcriptional regulator
MMAPKVSEEHMEERRNQILDAAFATFSRKGFHQATIEDIRLEAGLSRGAAYHYFKTKEDIIEGIRQRCARQAESVVALGASADDVDSTLVSLVDAIVSIMGSPGSVEASRLAVFLWAESLVNERIMAGQLPSFRPYLGVLTRAVAEAQQAGRLDASLEPEGVARIIAGAMIGLQVQLTWEPDIDIEAAHRAITSMITGRFWQSGPVA